MNTDIRVMYGRKIVKNLKNLPLSKLVKLMTQFRDFLWRHLGHFIWTDLRRTLVFLQLCECFKICIKKFFWFAIFGCDSRLDNSVALTLRIFFAKKIAEQCKKVKIWNKISKWNFFRRKIRSSKFLPVLFLIFIFEGGWCLCVKCNYVKLGGKMMEVDMNCSELVSWL